MPRADPTTSAFPALGALPQSPDSTLFRVWAPNAGSVAVRTSAQTHELASSGDGVFRAELPVRPGDDYEFVLDGGDSRPDPCSRFQPEGLRGPSRVVDAGPLRPAASFSPPALDEVV